MISPVLRVIIYYCSVNLRWAECKKVRLKEVNKIQIQLLIQKYSNKKITPTQKSKQKK